jgi:sec-independent protein translocase protein TatC
MSSTRSYAILAIVVIAALITPTPDAFTLGLMAGPMIILYEICIWLAWFDRKKNRLAEEQEAREEEERRALAYEQGQDDSDPYEGWKEADDHGWTVDDTGHDAETTYEHGDQGDHKDLEDVDFDKEPELPKDRAEEESKSDNPEPPKDDKS